MHTIRHLAPFLALYTGVLLLTGYSHGDPVVIDPEDVTFEVSGILLDDAGAPLDGSYAFEAQMRGANDSPLGPTTQVQLQVEDGFYAFPITADPWMMALSNPSLSLRIDGTSLGLLPVAAVPHAAFADVARMVAPSGVSLMSLDTELSTKLQTHDITLLEMDAELLARKAVDDTWVPVVENNELAVQALQAQVNALETSVGQLQASVNTLRTQVAEMSARQGPVLDGVDPQVQWDVQKQVLAVGEDWELALQPLFAQLVTLQQAPQGLTLSGVRLSWIPTPADVGRHLVILEAQGATSSISVELELIVLPLGMVLIPEGSFLMGDATLLDGGDIIAGGNTDDDPYHWVELDAFAISRYEVSEAVWQSAMGAADALGYTNLPNAGTLLDPVRLASWYGVTTWCNLLSEQEGLEPAYYVDEDFTEPLRTAPAQGGSITVFWKRDSNGYRLPTEAEWEKAARGGLQGQPWWWGDTPPSGAGKVLAYLMGPEPIAVDFPLSLPNGYGLVHACGNVSEWVWDGYDPLAYVNRASETAVNPVVDPVGTVRVYRGGYASGNPIEGMLHMRATTEASAFLPNVGLRLARSLPRVNME